MGLAARGGGGGAGHRLRLAGHRSLPNLFLKAYCLLATAMLLRLALQEPQAAGGKECLPCPKAECPDVAASTVASTQVAAVAQPGGGGVQQGTGADPSTEILLPPINLLELLGPRNGLTSVSDIAYMAYRCIPPLKDSLEGRTEAVLAERQAALLQQLLELVGTVKGSPADPQKTLLENLGLAGINHPQFFEARDLIAEHVGRYALHTDGRAMCCESKGKVVAAADLGKLGGEPRCAINCVGYPRNSFMLYSVQRMAEAITREGYCSDPPFYERGYAHEMVRRMANETYRHWFNGPTLADDSIIFAFQLLYEHHQTFLNQRWLGAVCLQNPFDAWSIQQIIFEVQPDLIIETGTANGGSALMWASILHLLGRGGRVMTLDLEPAQKTNFGANKANPWDSPLWKQYVTFVQGSTLDPAVHQQAAAAAAQAKRVLVLLDSNHQEQHVIQETELYCPLATPGSYCITQDTKMGRFNWEGPMVGVQKFLAAHPEFQSDRSRELYFTDHPSGYLKRAEA